MTSTRLPGKILREVLKRPLLEYQIERLRRVKNARSIVVATTVNPTDDIISEFCSRLGLSVFRGSEEDVLGRYYHAAVVAKAEHIVRVTSDCPLIDPAVIDQCINLYGGGIRFDYVSNTLERTYPRGLDVELFSMKTLAEMFREATLPYQREHVTPYIRDHRERFRIGQVKGDRDLSYHRWTVDTPDDFELIGRILEELYPTKPSFDLQDVIDLLKEHPDWVTLNQHIRQKELSEK